MKLKIIFLSIIFFASIVALTAICTKKDKVSKSILSHRLRMIFWMVACFYLSIIVMGSIIGIMISLAEMGLEKESVNAFIFIAFLLVVVLIGILVFYKIKANKTLKERY